MRRGEIVATFMKCSPKICGGKSEFIRSKVLRGHCARNFGIPIQNLWDEMIRNLWNSSIICGTAPQVFPGPLAQPDWRGGFRRQKAFEKRIDPPPRRRGPRPQRRADAFFALGVGRGQRGCSLLGGISEIGMICSRKMRENAPK